MAKTIKLDKKEEVSSAIQKLKAAKETEVIIEAERGSLVISNSNHLRLIRKTAEVLGKSVLLKTDDELGQALAVKAGMPLLQESPKLSRVFPRRIKTQSAKPRTAISDIPFNRPAPVKPTMPVKPTVLKRGTSVKAESPLGFASGMEPQGPASSSRVWKFSKYVVSVLALVTLAVFAAAVILPKTEITVYARSEAVTRDVEITVDKNAKTMDSSRMIIPGSIVNRELNDTKSFQTTGQKQVGTKAAGSVQIYNFTKNLLTLKASTTTLVINGKKYFFTKDATAIRPTARIGNGNEQEVDTGTLTAPIPITAETPGDSYNLPANSRFEIVNAALGTGKDVYAVSPVAISGGTSKTVRVLSQADLDSATEKMSEGLATVAEQDIIAAGDSTKKLLSSGTIKEILAKTANKDVGDEATEFDMTVIARISGLSYNEQDVKNLVLDKINAVLSSDKYLLPDGKQDASARYKSLDLANGKGVLAVHFETVAAYKVDNDNLSQVLAGKNASEIKEILLTKPEIDRVDVKFSPFFVNKAPRFNGKIYVSSVLSR